MRKVYTKNSQLHSCFQHTINTELPELKQQNDDEKRCGRT